MCRQGAVGAEHAGRARAVLLPATGESENKLPASSHFQMGVGHGEAEWMPVGEIAGGLLGGLFRLAGQFVIEVVFELAVKGAGYLICRRFAEKVDADGVVVVSVGVLFWSVVAGGGYVLYRVWANA